MAGGDGGWGWRAAQRGALNPPQPPMRSENTNEKGVFAVMPETGTCTRSAETQADGGDVGTRTKENLKSTWRGASRGGGNELQVGVDGGEGVAKALVVAGVAGHSVEDG